MKGYLSVRQTADKWGVSVRWVNQYILAGRIPGCERFGHVWAVPEDAVKPGLEKCFGQVAKILKPGGFFMICNESDGTDPTSVRFEKNIDGMKNYTAEEIEAALKAAGFSEVTSEHHPSRPWITVLARK